MNCSHPNFKLNCPICLMKQKRDNPPMQFTPPATPIPPAGICVLMNSTGVGDTLLAATAVQGLRRDNPDIPLYYCVRKGNEKWSELFPQWQTVTGIPRGCRVFDVYATYKDELRHHTVRWEQYSRACHTQPVLPEFKQCKSLQNFGRDYENCVVLSPFSAHQSRCWNVKHFQFLCEELTNRGNRVVVLDSTNVGSRCSRFKNAELVIGQEPSRVAAIVKAAKVTVGLDSAISHLCGVIGATCITLVAQVDGQKVFGFYPTVKVIQAPYACGKCYFSGANFTAECRSHCMNLNAIRVEDVLNEMDNLDRLNLPLV